MTHSTDTIFLSIENAAHGGAFGKNPIPEPTEAQCKAGNYKMGRVSFQGLSIAIEQPRGTYRNGIDSKTGKRWTSRMAAHYGYISGTKGADGDGVDCFVGPYPQSEIAYAINQYIDGRFDEHKIMLAFPDEETARNAYLHSFDRGWNGLKSMIPLSINQLKWWLKHGNMKQPLKSENLPPEGLEAMTKKVHWDGNAQPYNATIDQVLYEIRQSDSGENLLLDAVSIAEIIADSDGILALDALVTPYIKLQRKMEILQGVMERMGTGIKPVAMQITEPFKQFGVANVAVVYELSDGQTVSIYFHNPDATPAKLSPNDDVISYKWLLNKKDITIVVAPERGQDLNIREVARRILKLAEKNSPAFARANAKRADRMQNIQSLKDEIVVLEGELKSAQNELEIAKVAAEDRKPEDTKPILPETDFNVDIASLIEALPGLDGYGITSLIMRTNGEINAVSGHDIKASGVTDADILAAYGKGLLREAAADDLPDNQTVVETALNPTSPEDYAKIMADPELQLNYQDVLDSFIQERIIAVRNALRELGWDGEKFKDLSKNGVVAKFTFKQVGAGANLVGYDVNGIADDLSKTPEQLAAEIDAAVPIQEDSKELNPAASEIEVPPTSEIEAESEDMKAAREFLKSVVEGDKDKDDLMALLDKIEASANAIIEAGKGEDYDSLIGAAAEKWASLDQQVNG
ncbi:hypothetical protein [Nitrosomonas sp.]|uniref:defense against restriction DarA-related protein n=1 Tax=Nitrosomonas sp. TaxID=42353 RepID=UPI0025D59C05|nr:hypothetical protein [Nitrosomonas sp.]